MMDRCVEITSKAENKKLWTSNKLELNLSERGVRHNLDTPYFAEDGLQSVIRQLPDDLLGVEVTRVCQFFQAAEIL